MSVFWKATERTSVNREANIEIEQKMAEDLLRRKNESDGKVADNMLRISIFLNFSILFMNVFLILISSRILSSQYVGEGSERSLLGISIRFLTIDFKMKKEHIFYDLFCISDDQCGYGCELHKDKDYKELSIIYNVDCQQMKRLQTFGIFYIIFMSVGNFFTLINNLTLIFLVYNKVKLITAEYMNVIARWDVGFYYIGVFGYIIGSNVIFSSNLYFGREIVIPGIILILSTINFYCIKTNLSQRIRIKARGLYLESNIL